MLQPGCLCLGMQPVVDEIIVPDIPLSLDEAEVRNKVTIMAGWNAQDGALFVPLGIYCTFSTYQIAALVIHANVHVCYDWYMLTDYNYVISVRI